MHKWQGWTDKFLATPPGGVTDRWFAASKRILGADMTLAYHHFRLQEQDVDAGRELGVAVIYSPLKKLDLQFKMARYWADEYASDTTKNLGGGELEYVRVAHACFAVTGSRRLLIGQAKCRRDKSSGTASLAGANS